MTHLKIAASASSRFEHIEPSDLNEAEQERVIELALGILEERNRPGRKLQSPSDSSRYNRLRLAEERREVFGAVFLNTRNQVVADEILFRGTIDSAPVHPRIVVEKALEHNAAAVILYHNHPSGGAEPSMSDERQTRRLREALAVIDVRVLDHFVVGHQECCSFAERGLL
jgi:DNA repair protein RadC